MRIENLMSQPVHTCNQSCTLNEAAQLLWEHDCGAIPIVDDHDQLVGMLTDRDICMAAYTKGKPLKDIQIGEAMSKKVYSCQQSERIEDAEQTMSDNKVRRIPVVDDEQRPIAIISLTDIARSAAAANSKHGKSNGLERHLAATLAAICEPDLPHSLARRA